MKSLLYIPFLCLALGTVAQEVHFNSIYDSGGNEVSRGIKTVDSGYLTVCELFQAGAYHILISKIGLEGQKLWDRKYLLHPAGHGIGLNSITEDALGNFWICGWIMIGLDSSQAYAFSFSAEGDSLWSIIDTTSFQSLKGIVPKSNGNVVVTGFDRTNGSNAKVMLAEWDSAGTVLWKKTYFQPPGYTGIGWSLQPTPDSGYVIGASIGQGIDYDPWIIKTDSAGNMQWDRKFDHSDWEEAGASILVSSDNFIYAGSSITKKKINETIYLEKGFLAKLSSNNQLLWSYEYGQSLRGSGFTQLKEDRNGNILAVTRSQQLHDSLGAFHGWLLKTNPDGDSLWEKRYRFDYDTSLICTNDAWSLDTTLEHGIVSAGFVQCDDSITAEHLQDLWVVKFDSNGCFDTLFDCTVGVNELDYNVKRNLGLKIWPNPNNGSFSLDIHDLSEYKIQIFNIQGHIVSHKIDEDNLLSVQNAPDGIYVITLSRGTSFLGQRFVINTKTP